MRITATMEIELPDTDATPQQIQEWLEFNLSKSCQLLPSPIQDQDIRAISVSWHEAC